MWRIATRESAGFQKQLANFQKQLANFELTAQLFIHSAEKGCLAHVSNKPNTRVEHTKLHVGNFPCCFACRSWCSSCCCFCWDVGAAVNVEVVVIVVGVIVEMLAWPCRCWECCCCCCCCCCWRYCWDVGVSVVSVVRVFSIFISVLQHCHALLFFFVIPVFQLFFAVSKCKTNEYSRWNYGYHINSCHFANNAILFH